MSPVAMLGWGIAILAVSIGISKYFIEWKKALSQSLGVLIGIAFSLWVLLYAIPFIAQNSENPIRNNYAPILGNGSGEEINLFDFFAPDPVSPLDEYEVQTNQSVPVVPNGSAAVATPVSVASSVARHTVLRGETLGEIATLYGTTVDELASLNGINDPNTIGFGQVLLIPDNGSDVETAVVEVEEELESVTVTETVIAARTPTPIPVVFNFTLAYQALASLKQNGGASCPEEYAETIGEVVKARSSRDCGLLLANIILREQPSDPVALAARDEIIEDTERLTAMKRLGERTSPNIMGLKGFTFAAGAKNEVDSLLRGYEFKVIDIERAWNGGSYLEAATLEIISEGWLKGETFQMAVAHATRWGGKFIGDEFEVQ